MNEGGDQVTLESPVRLEPEAELEQHVEAAVTPTEWQTPTSDPPPVFELRNFNAFYGSFRAVKDFSAAIKPNQITALIGPSGSGKSTVLRWLNRMNDLVPGAS